MGTFAFFQRDTTLDFLADLQDVSSTPALIGQALLWDGAEWAAGNIPAAGGALNSVAISLNGTSVVPTGTAADPIFDLAVVESVAIEFNGTALVDTGTPGSPAYAFSALTTVSITTDGTALGVTPGGSASDPTFNIRLLSGDGGNDLAIGGDGGLYYSAPAAAALSLNDLIDVSAVAPAAGNLLGFNGLTWAPTVVGPGATSSFTETLAIGRWIHDSGTGATTEIRSTSTDFGNILTIGANGGSHLAPLGLADLTNVDLTGLVAGQVLSYDGTNFTPTTPAVGGTLDSVSITTDGTALGVTPAGTAADPTFDIRLLSGDADQELTIGSDGGLHYAGCSAVNVITSTLPLTLDETNADDYVRVTGLGGVPTVGNVPAAAVGESVHIANFTGATITISPTAGVTLNGLANIPDQGGVTVLIVGVDEWDILGGA